MIAKHFPMKDQSKSNVSSLVEYLEDEKSQDRVAALKIFNCISEDAESAAIEMKCTQNLNSRAKSDKTYHAILSLSKDDDVSIETLQIMAKRMIDALGYGDHQALVITHADTDNLHCHLVINKIHPETYKMHNPDFDYKIMSSVCADLENEYGLKKVNHQAHKNSAQNKAEDFENHTGIQSLLLWAKEHAHEKLSNAQSWADFHRVLDENGLELNQKNKGFTIQTKDGSAGIKASSLDRQFSQKNLEKKFGQYEPPKAQHSTKKRYTAKPISRVDTSALYAEYKRQQNSNTSERQRQAKAFKLEKEALIKSAKSTAKLRRDVVKAFKASPMAKRIVYKKISESLLKEIKSVNETYRGKSKNLTSSAKLESWADWLRSQAMKGNDDALKALRGRTNEANLIYNTIKGTSQSAGSAGSVGRDNITKSGTVLYSNDRYTLREDGLSIKVTRDTGHAGMIAALRLARDKYGETIQIDGTDDFKQKAIIAAASANLKVRFSDAEMQNILIKVREKINERSGTGSERDHGQIRYGRKPVGASAKIGLATTAAQINHIRNSTGLSKAENENGLSDVQARSLDAGRNGIDVSLPSVSQADVGNKRTDHDSVMRRSDSEVKSRGR